MRKLIFTAVFALLSIFYCYAQDTQVYNFNLKDGNVYWQTVYTDIDSAAVVEYFNNSMFESKNDNTYQCTLTLKNYSDKGYMNRAFILNDESTIYFTVQIKNDRYRVTVTDIIWRSVTTVYGVSSASTSDLKSYAYNKKGKVKFKEGGIIEKQLNECLLQLFNALNNQNKTDILDTDF